MYEVQLQTLTQQTSSNQPWITQYIPPTFAVGFSFYCCWGVAHGFSCNNIYEWCVLFIVQGSSSLTICELVCVAFVPLIAIFECLIFTFKGCFECRPPRLQNCGNRSEEISRLASETICKRFLKVLPTHWVVIYTHVKVRYNIIFLYYTFPRLQKKGILYFIIISIVLKFFNYISFFHTIITIHHLSSLSINVKK